MYQIEYSLRYIGSVSSSSGTRRYAQRLPREVRREQLLDATLSLIARDGWSALRINRVADEAEIAKSVIYAVFGSMEELQRAVMVREQERAFELAERAIAAAGSGGNDPVRSISAGLEVFLAGVAEQPMTWLLVLVPADNTPPGVRAAILEGRERWRREIENIVSGLLADADTDIELVSHVIRGNVEYLARLIIEEPEKFTPERITSLCTQVAGLLLQRKAS
jgi:AcrR family transcriptional regulator